ncbi:response regulator [Candidatus Woesearchaeota archaeon]|nr:response regulator [Candidatus Woesearchaeota archaeon]
MELIRLNTAVVDDDSANRNIFKSILESMGHEVTLYSDGIHAYDAMRNGELKYLDLMVTDYNMPSMNGTELIKRLRREGYTFPIMLVSGDYESRGKGEYTLFLRKPMALEDFFSGIGRCLLSRPDILIIGDPDNTDDITEALSGAICGGVRHISPADVMAGMNGNLSDIGLVLCCEASGYQPGLLAERAKQHLHAPVVYCTDNPTCTDTIDTKAINSTLTKPVDRESLRVMLHKFYNPTDG